jgi:hypothetical protein
MDLGIRVGYEQAAPPELDFNDIHFSTNRSPPPGLMYRPIIFETSI